MELLLSVVTEPSVMVKPVNLAQLDVPNALVSGVVQKSFPDTGFTQTQSLVQKNAQLVTLHQRCHITTAITVSIDISNKVAIVLTAQIPAYVKVGFVPAVKMGSTFL